ncbi:MAG TPA: hypothetical protein VMC83_39070 [Streptosporangiaceae bacterium]|nr:hypothetical protein [Streptosporangiaceae bacterium]
MRALVVLAAGLALPGVLPALAAAGWSAVVVYLAPVIGTVMAAVAAEIELGLGGSVVPDYLAVAATVNITVIAWWVTVRRGTSSRHGQAPRTWGAWAWSVLAVIVVAGCLAVPLRALRGAFLTGDGNSIWTTHALMVYGGHHALLSSLLNQSYVISNPDYPPLVPAASALSFKFYGLGNLHLGVDMTVLVTACALGVVAMGIVAVSDVAAAGRGARWPARVVAVAAAGAIGVVGFAVSGNYAIEGYADLVWAAFAVGAVIWGLVLPRSPRALAVAWICAAAASLTKNEGLTTALIIIVAIALRYRPFSLPGPMARRWAERAVFVLLPALPGLAYAGMMRLLGVHDAFFTTGSTETPLTRATATVAGMARFLHVAPLALAVLLAGCWFLRADRQRAGLANPVWLWICGLGSLAVIFVTYVFGDLEIHGWLLHSVNRTTIFAQVLLYTEIAGWLVIAAEGLFGRAPARADGEPAPASEPMPEVRDSPRQPAG